MTTKELNDLQVMALAHQLAAAESIIHKQFQLVCLYTVASVLVKVLLASVPVAFIVVSTLCLREVLSTLIYMFIARRLRKKYNSFRG